MVGEPVVKIIRVALTGALLLMGVVPVRAEAVRIARQFGLSYLPLILMQDRGLLEAEGRARGLELVPEWVTFTGGPPINDALISGNIDLASGGVGPMLTIWGRTRGSLRVRGVAVLGSMPMWLMSNRAAVQTVRDFTEKDRIALPGVKVSVQAVVLQMAAAQAWGAGQQYRLDPLTVSMGHPDGLMALLGGGSEVTAHFTAAPFMYEEAADPRVHRVLNSYDVLGGPHTFNVVWATARYANGHPVVLAAFRAALERAMTLIHTDPAGAAAAWVRVENTRIRVDQAAAMIQRPENEWTTTPRRMMDFARFMAGTGAIAQAPESWRELFFGDAAAGEGS